MKILYYHQYFSTPAGAGGTRSYELARTLVAAGHQVTMVCLAAARSGTGLSGSFRQGQRRGWVDGIQVIEFDLHYSNHDSLITRTLTFARYVWRSLGLVFTADYDLVFATSTPLTAAIPGILARWLRGKPFVFEVRDLWPELPRAMGVVRNPLILALLSGLEWISYHSAQHCIGLAPGICEGIHRRGIPLSRITSVPNACDLERFTPLPEAKAKQPERIPGLQPGQFVAAFTGAHGLANGLDAVLDAAAVLLERQRGDIQLLFIGDGKCKPALQVRAERQGLSNCHFLPPMPKGELAQCLQQSVHVGLMILADVPAFYNGTSPNKFFDYLAAGLPIVTNYPGWLARLITEHQLGHAVPPRDPQALAEALMALADHPGDRRQQARHARQLAEQEFARPVLARRWCQVLESVAREAGVPVPSQTVLEELAR